ncbi:magnesium transporter [Mycoplasma putrefaciens]|uniref:Magnesium transporter MgtE n=1 Tax=Mycoplasma putrefaciens (strain ATCC 15718 / NCTC 10155 / C30 KS-1 / KS-1) TaxID=743965 RepID=A0A7U3ZT52_MYCPK|nr:magnesium transporter [Mycoplasma putrefaciens]AEM68993.1 magnesium transporter [Mycoplasma putrefaciens KS1]
MINANYLEEQILKLYKSKKIQEILAIIDDTQPADFAEVLNHIDQVIAFVIYKKIKKQQAAEIFTYLSDDLREYILANISVTKLKELVNELYSDDIINAIEDMPTEIVKKVFDAASKDQRKELANILKYDDYTAGSIMSVNFLSIRETKTVSKAISLIQKNHDEYDEIDDLFVVNKLGQLIGTIEVKDLILNENTTRIGEFMNKKFISINSNQSQEEASNMFKKYDINTLPVVDDNNILVGIITVDDVIDVLIEETNQDIQKYIGIKTSETNYFETSIWKMFKSRSLSLILVLLLGFITNILVVYLFKAYNLNFEKNSSQQFMLMLFPLTLIISGVIACSANQTLLMAGRAISLEQLHKKDYKTIFTKEIVVSLMLSISLIIFNFIRMMLVYLIEYKTDFNNKYIWLSILVASIGIVVSILVSNLIALILPLIARKIGRDSSAISLPLITLIVDIIAVIVFLGIGIWFI